MAREVPALGVRPGAGMQVRGPNAHANYVRRFSRSLRNSSNTFSNRSISS